MSVKAELHVDGMDCKHCKSVETIINTFDGIENVNVDLDKSRVTITYDDLKSNLVDLKQAIMMEGYTVIEI